MVDFSKQFSCRTCIFAGSWSEDDKWTNCHRYPATTPITIDSSWCGEHTQTSEEFDGVEVDDDIKEFIKKVTGVDLDAPKN